MKFQKLLVIAASLCLLVVFLSRTAKAQPPLPGIIAKFCQEVVRIADEGDDELDQAARHLEDCGERFSDCGDGLFNDDAASCISEFADCTSDSSRDASQACEDFSEELAEAYEDELRAARSEGAGVERRFQKWIQNRSEQCLAPAVEVANKCAGIDN